MLPLNIFGETVRNLRLERGLSQEDLAEKSQLHRTYIGGIERGERNVCLLNILYLAKALEVTPAELFQAFNEQLLTELPEK